MTPIRMHYGFDESGSFAFAHDGFDSVAIAAVACPDSVVPSLEQCVTDLLRGTSDDELHASGMDDATLARTCGLIGAFDVSWRAIYTDTRLMPRAQQDAFRRRQVETMDKAIEASSILKEDPKSKAEAVQTLNRIRLATRVCDADYLEFLVLFPRLIGDIIDASLLTFRCTRWAADLGDLKFFSDAKLKGKLSMGEKTLAKALPRIIANNDKFTLPVPAEWRDDHDFNVSHRDPETGSITVPALLGDGLNFVDSKSSLVVQVADVIAYVAKRATDDHADEVAQRCYRLLRRRGSCVATPAPVRIFSDRLGPDGDPGWYEHLCA
jgi:hypothetical protein